MNTPERVLIERHRRQFATEYAAGIEPPLHPDYCGPCRDCQTALAEYRRAGVKRNIRYRNVAAERRQAASSELRN